MLKDKSVHEFLEVVDSSAPTPGGGSVSGLAGSLGAALARMVGTLSYEKKAFAELPEEIQEEMKMAGQKLEPLKIELEDIIDKDSSAFDEVMEAFKLPKNTDEEKKVRSEAVQKGYKVALEVPMRCAEACLEVLKLQNLFAKHGTVNAVSDIGVGVLMASSGLEGACMNVLINLGAMKDEAYIAETRKKVDVLIKEEREIREELLDVVYERLK